MDEKHTWLIYGAYGYSGELVVQEAIAQQRPPVLAGRNETKTRALAEKYNLPYRVFNAIEAEMPRSAMISSRSRYDTAYLT